MTTICGVDGCALGWLALTKELPSGRISWSVHPSAERLFAEKKDAQVIAIHIPIGLPEKGPRLCDLQARRLLGATRGTSIFPAPIRPLLSAATPDEANEMRYKLESKNMSRPAYRVLARARDVNSNLQQAPELRQRVREMHPEVSFFFLAGGRPMRDGKKTEPGRTERQRLLEAPFGHYVADTLALRYYMDTTADDVLEAFAALWSAERILNGTCVTIPAAPLVDALGLPMEIVA
jgi:predicted RNase H-like nuclease